MAAQQKQASSGGDLSRQSPATSAAAAAGGQQWGQWMQYPAAAMAMMHQQQQQQQMMYPPQHYMSSYGVHPHHPHPYHHHLGPYGGGYQSHMKHHKQDEIRTLWAGDLFPWMDETYLHACFATTGQVYSVKVIRNKQTGQSEGYGFVEFYSRPAAEKVLQTYNGSLMPSSEQAFRLNWATFSQGGEKRSSNDASGGGGGGGNGSDLSIFVGDLAADVTDALLQETFSGRFSSVKGAKVVIDANTGRSKGYGFVRFSDEAERSRAISEMNGVYCSSRAMRIGVATPKKSAGFQPYSQAVVLAGGQGANGIAGQGQSEGESNNTTIFVGGLDSDVSDEDLRQPFSQFGEVVSVKIPAGKACGFVQFADRKSAESAIETLNGTVIGKQTVRLSWGRTPGHRQWRGDSGNQWNGAHHGSQGYGYAVAQHTAPAVANGAS